MSTSSNQSGIATMDSINIHEAKTHLSRYVEEASAGKEIVIARGGRPVARLVALESHTTEPRRLGLGKGKFQVPADFDDQNRSAIEAMFYGSE